MFWVCLTIIRIINIFMLPPRETFDRSFFVDIVLGSLKKNLAQIPQPNPEQGDPLHLDNTRPRLAHHENQANNLTRLSHSAYSRYLALANISLFGYLKVVPEGGSFGTAEELQGKVTDISMSIATSTFRAVFEEWKSRLLRYIEAAGEYL
jgi:hypothetical protein